MDISMSWVVAVLVGIVGGGWVWVQRWRQRHSKDPKTWPLVGAQMEVFFNFHRLHDWLLAFFSDEHRTFKLRLVSSTIYFTVDPLNVEHILKTNFLNYPKGEKQHYTLYDLLGDGIFNTDNEIWKKHRKVASFEFSNRKLRDFSIDAFREDALHLVQILHSAASSQQPLDLQDLFMRMTLDSICKIGFGVHMGSLSPSLPDIPFGKSFDTVNEIVTARLLNPFWELQKALNLGKEKVIKQELVVLNSFTSNVIHKRKAECQAGKNEARADLLSRFIAVNEGQPEAYSDQELRDAILNFVIAGRDTTAITLSWFIYCICNHPHVAERVFEETVEVLDLQSTKNYSFKEVADKITYEMLCKMHYLHAALTETLRLYPAVPRDSKFVAGDDVLPDGTHVERGSRITYVPYSMGRMEFLWGKDALSYNPDRWLKDGVFQAESPFKFSAFQAGPRICLGKESAYLQMKMTAALLLHFFRFHSVPGHLVQYRIMLVMPMAHGLCVQVSHR